VNFGLESLLNENIYNFMEVFFLRKYRCFQDILSDHSFTFTGEALMLSCYCVTKADFQHAATPFKTISQK